MREEDEIRLRHMLEAAHDAISFTRGRTRSDLDKDRMLALSVVKAIEIVGEAAYRISQETKDELPSLPWVDIVGMRHRLVHAYFDIDLDVLWRTVQDDLPALVAILERLVPPIKNG